MTERVLAVIPARSGSKRFPGKNVADIDGKPLLAHTIEHAAEATTVDRAVVSTDDEGFADIAREWGGDVPFERPAELATDTATADEAVRHVVSELRDRGETYDIVCMLLVTTPLRNPSDIDAAVQKLIESDAKSVVSTVAFDHPPMYAVDTHEDGYLYPYFGEEYLWGKTRSQEYPDLHRPNGVVFAATVAALEGQESFYTDRTVEYEMPQKRSIDIDETHDLDIAEAILEAEDD